MKNTLCALVAIGLACSAIPSSKKLESHVETKSPPKAQVLTYESELYDYVITKFLIDKPNKYRKEGFKEERPIAHADYTAFLKAKSTSEHKGFDILVFDGKKQKLYHLNKLPGDDVELVRAYTCSSGKYGFSNRPKSKKTATGLMFIETKIGDGAKLGTVFDWQYRGKISPRKIVSGQNTYSRAYMTTRRMDFFTPHRHQALHGTNHEAYLGKPRSHGCIRLSNADIVTLFDSVESGTPFYVFTDIKKETGLDPNDY